MIASSTIKNKLYTDENKALLFEEGTFCHEEWQKFPCLL
jgi:hypothetical protein